MMQVANVKQVSKTQPANKAFHQTLAKQSKKSDVKIELSSEPVKVQSCNRFLEAYSDCV